MILGYLLGLFLLVFVSPVYAVELNCGDTGAPACISDIVKVLEHIIGLLAPAAGIVFFIMLLVGGFRFIKSRGDPKRVGEARSTLTYAAIGIILVVVAWLILKLIKDLTGANVTTVDINPPQP